MTWLVFAIIGHISNGAAFVIDKALLSTAFKRSATYATMIGGLSLVVALAAPFVAHWPSASLLPAVIGFGVTFVFALWAFFAALKRGEATRIVPVIGSLIPIITLIGTMTLFGERLTGKQLAGFAILLASTWLLTMGKTRHELSTHAIIICVIAAVLFAVSTLFGKFAFDHGDFLGVFVSSRIIAGMTGIAIGFIIPSAGREALSIIRPKRTSKHNASAGWAILGQSLGAVGFVLVQAAISQGSASIVNALQAVQYAFLVLAAFALRKRAPQLLNEKLDRKTIAIKIAALATTAVGLLLVV